MTSARTSTYSVELTDWKRGYVLGLFIVHYISIKHKILPFAGSFSTFEA